MIKNIFVILFFTLFILQNSHANKTVLKKITPIISPCIVMQSKYEGFIAYDLSIKDNTLTVRYKKIKEDYSNGKASFEEVATEIFDLTKKETSASLRAKITPFDGIVPKCGTITKFRSKFIELDFLFSHGNNQKFGDTYKIIVYMVIPQREFLKEVAILNDFKGQPSCIKYDEDLEMLVAVCESEIYIWNIQPVLCDLLLQSLEDSSLSSSSSSSTN